MKEITFKQAKDFDAKLINEIGIPSIVLMENAGKNSANIIFKKILKTNNILICCGTGNNGGDGFVIARHLKILGVNNIKILLLGYEKNIKNDALINFNIIKKLGFDIYFNNEEKLIKKSDIIIDAILGSGLTRSLEARLLNIVKYINTLNKKVFAIDLPTGFLFDKGKILGECIKADYTITFNFPKKGMLSKVSKKFIGKLFISNIGYEC